MAFYFRVWKKKKKNLHQSLLEAPPLPSVYFVLNVVCFDTHLEETHTHRCQVDDILIQLLHYFLPLFLAR